MAEPLISNETWLRLAKIERFYCPLCGDVETLGERCRCGFLWSEGRRDHKHYARLLNDQEAEKLRHVLARKLTRTIVAECDEYTKRQGPRLFCTRRALARMWRDPE